MPKPLLSIPTSIEERLSGWIRIQEQQAAQTRARQPRPSITLSRQFGCEGFPVALRLQTMLEAATHAPWTVFDRALLDRVAEDEGLSRQMLSELGDEGSGFEAFGFHPKGALTTDEAFRKLALFILKVARTGHAIIVGRGGAMVCRDLPHVFHFRLVAGFDWRAASLAQRAGLPLAEAAERVKVQGKLRGQYIQRTLGADVEDPLNYDAVFNNARHTKEEIAGAICGYLHLQSPL